MTLTKECSLGGQRGDLKVQALFLGREEIAKLLKLQTKSLLRNSCKKKNNREKRFLFPVHLKGNIASVSNHGGSGYKTTSKSLRRQWRIGATAGEEISAMVARTKQHPEMLACLRIFPKGVGSWGRIPEGYMAQDRKLSNGKTL